MKKFGIETKVTILAIFIVGAVVMSGFLGYKSLSQIVNSIHNETRVDYKLIVIKDIALDLLEIENNIQLFTLTKNKENLKDYEKVNKRLKRRVTLLAGLSNEQNEMSHLIDSAKYLVEAKLGIWEEIKQIHTVNYNPGKDFEELYTMLEKTMIDTVKVEVQIAPPKKKGIFKRIFSKKDSVTTRIDTTLVEKTVENKEIKEEIRQLETDLLRREKRNNKLELQLIEQNIEVTGRLNNLIARIEKEENDGLIEKTEEADRLATLTYNRLTAFSVMAVVLLLVVLYLFFRYLQRAKTYQKVLTTAKNEAERLSRAKEVFMANVSHEMRTPVNAIYGLTEQLLQVRTGAKVHEQLVILLKSAEHLKNVVKDTLDFSKIQAKKLKLEEIDFSPEDVISEILYLYKHEASGKNISLLYHCKNELPSALLGDPFRLKQILINTIGNAVKFTESGSVAVFVELQEINKNRFHLHFRVEDTGIGISKENLKIIFEDFIQVESDYTRKFGGTGLGLSIVKKLIELLKGSISIESELNKGTQISFYIPYKLGNPKNIKQLQPKEIRVPDEIKKLNILGVDDEEFNRFLLKVIFEKWGVNYKEAQNGEAAVKIALENDFDLILMDVRMPKLNGIEASALIKKEKPDSNIVMVTAVDSEAEMKLFQESGIRNFLSKPFSELELFNIINTVLKIDVIKEKLTAKEFEIGELERLANGDRDFMKELILIFIKSTQSGMENIRQALKEKNWQGISDAAHKMAPPCKHIMAIDLYDKIKKLENNVNDMESIHLLPELISTIGQKVESINKSLSDIVNSDRFNG